MNFDEGVISRTVKTQKLFNLQVGQCLYQNLESFRKRSPDEQDLQVKISNVICKMVDNKLIKSTEIQFRDKVIIIQDLYKFQLEKNLSSSQNGNGSTQGSSDGSHGNTTMASTRDPKKKKLIFKKKPADFNTSLPRRNTKNIAKNFCRAFLCYLDQREDVEGAQKIKSLIEKYKLNNQTISKIVTQESLRPKFKDFLIMKANQWINVSKINDKKIHKQAIKLYLELIEEGNFQFEESKNQDEDLSEVSKVSYQEDQVFEEEQ